MPVTRKKLAGLWSHDYILCIFHMGIVHEHVLGHKQGIQYCTCMFPSRRQKFSPRLNINEKHWTNNLCVCFSTVDIFAELLPVVLLLFPVLFCSFVSVDWQRARIYHCCRKLFCTEHLLELPLGRILTNQNVNQEQKMATLFQKEPITLKNTLNRFIQQQNLKPSWQNCRMFWTFQETLSFFDWKFEPKFWAVLVTQAIRKCNDFHAKFWNTMVITAPLKQNYKLTGLRERNTS